MVTTKEIGIINLKNDLFTNLENCWQHVFKVRMQTLACDNQELRYLSTDLEELLNKIEGIQTEYLKPIKL
jgi:hypothetical protein